LEGFSLTTKHQRASGEWRHIADDREKYRAYLCSREWALLRNAVRERCGGKCERCKVNEMECVHHLTYARKYDERLDDLAGWCNFCHEFTHGKSDYDPVDVLRKGLSWRHIAWECMKNGMSREQFIAFIDSQHDPSELDWKDMLIYMALGKAVADCMGREWLIDAADGAFVRRTDEIDLTALISKRRQEQGIE
jgi:hypothetical protein